MKAFYPFIFDRFERALRKRSMPHAWLFLGPDNIGKKQLCYALAEMLLGQPFDDHTCPHPDFLMLTERSSQGFSQLKQKILQTTYHGGFRIVCITNLHTLNTFILNALLKLLEEPPPHTVFLLTAQSSNILPTVSSRCLTQTLLPLSYKDCVQQFGNNKTLYLLSYGYPVRAEKIKKENILELVVTFWNWIDRSLKSPCILPPTFVADMVEHIVSWQEWTDIWFHQQYLAQQQVLTLSMLHQTITQRLQEGLLYHFDPKFLFYQIFAILSMQNHGNS